MKEIKFRAWDIERKGYIQGFNMVNYHGYFNKGLKKSIYRYDTEWEEGKYILEPYTIEKDRKGNEIYLGDIAELLILCSRKKFIEINKTIKPALVEIIYKNGAFGFQHLYPELVVEEDRGWRPLYCEEDSHMWTKYFEIISNVHENPELLG